MPPAKLKTRPVTSIQPPQISSPARWRSVRPLRRVSHRPASRQMRAEGISHATSPPQVPLNRRVIPVGLPKPAAPPPGAPPPADPSPGGTAGDPGQPVVAEGKLQNAVVGGASDERPV